MAKQPKAAPVDTGAEIVDELHVATAEDGVEFTDVTGQDDLPQGVVDPADEDEDEGDKKAAKPAVKAKPAADDDIPDELKGKTPAQLSKMYRDAQQVIGRQGTELGELRRAADGYIKSALTRAAAPVPQPKDKEPEAEKEVDDVTFFTNPKAAIAAAVANHPAIKALQGETKENATRELIRQRTDAATKFGAAHPDAKEVSQDPAFKEWVLKSPIRRTMLLRAHQHYDLAAGMEVFNTWKELKAARVGAGTAADGKPSEKQPAGKPVADKQAARVPSGGNPSPRSSGTAGKEGKIYRRADVIRLMINDPNRYELMADEITKAYTENRVR
jgi:hypothetical protein